MSRMLFLMPLIALATPAAAAETPAAYLGKAGAGDLFEQTSSKIVLETTSDARVKSFATMMIGDHGKSAAMLKSAAAASGVKAPPPGLTPDQQAKVAALKQARGVARDTLYWQQQKAAHAQALQLHQDYAANGSNRSLKDAAAKIVSVVKHHIDLLNAGR
ncbi:hypothetical protein Sj15T_02930 [Sphingobium sp. TA15]|uniref:DUF4142 domain-containing protein n=1 Tax=Sphingobium indicum (strain DSM 16413 / CCM 7287 / MTCC 6362 / UT26 / NBRC 101211 / UT26S) TaxID=452662 RepID=D4Z027_SPHIU|nr:DUF4142 domain-containing protein [Sphingobium indicum]BAI95959.1 conserved hypothetical protein [Sphingobium indicum UT26S]BDD65272.1 hypothetical protein Sj15T_02930 [Sphingobium sp. TA15]